MLGPAQVAWCGESFYLARRQARALLYYLANAYAPVSRDNLQYLLWPEEPEGKARRNLIRLVSILRRELPRRDILLVSPESLQVNHEQVWVDAERFSHLSAVGKTREQAIPLYQGSFLMGFSLASSREFDFWLTEEQGRYEALYLKTLAELVRVKREQGAYAAAIQYAQLYLGVDELAEDIHRDLINLYAAQGDRAAALRQYETCTQVLERELGVSPLPETHAAYESALKSRPIPAPPSIRQTWAVLPSLQIPLIGRENAWEALESAYQQLHTGGLILISGEAGVGKSRLMQEFATQGQQTVLTGNNHPSTQTLPYHMLLQALRQAMPHPQLWASITPIWPGELIRLIPEMRDYFPDLPQPVAVEMGQAQARLFEALTQVFFGLAQTTPLLLCLDDLQWIDEASKAWLSAIAPKLAGSQVCIVGTYRQERQEPLLDIQRAFRREGLLAEVALDGLSLQAIIDVLEQTPTHDPVRTQLASRLHRATGGNVFFMLEMVRSLLESKQLEAPPEVLPLPKTVQETIQTRLERLTPLARQILDAAAVLSPDLELDLLWQTAGRTELEAADGLDELIQRQVMRAQAGGLAFQHELVRMTAYQNLNPWRRKLLHRRAGDALGKIYTGNQDVVAAQMAFHYDAAEDYQQALPAYEQAAEAAQAVFAHEEAIRHLQRAIALLSETQADPALSASLYEGLGINLVNAGHFEMARSAYRQAIAAYSPENVMCLARLNWRLAKTHLSQLHYDEAEIQLGEALSALETPPAQGEVAWQHLWLDIQMDRLTLFAYLFDIKRFDALSQEIAPVMEKIGTLKHQLSYSSKLFFINLVKHGYRPTTETFAMLDKHLELARKSQDPRDVVFAQFSQGYGFLHADEIKSAEEWIQKSLNQTRQLDLRVHEARCLAFLSTVYRRLGEIENTAEYAQLAAQKGAEVGSRHYVAHSLANSAWLAYHQGETDLALKKAQKAARDFLDTKVPFTWLALIVLLAIYRDAGDIDHAINAADTMLDPLQQRLPNNLTAALAGAVHNWNQQDIEKTRQFLEQAVQLAKEQGYL